MSVLAKSVVVVVPSGRTARVQRGTRGVLRAPPGLRSAPAAALSARSARALAGDVALRTAVAGWAVRSRCASRLPRGGHAAQVRNLPSRIHGQTQARSWRSLACATRDVCSARGAPPAAAQTTALPASHTCGPTQLIGRVAGGGRLPCSAWGRPRLS